MTPPKFDRSNLWHIVALGLLTGCGMLLFLWLLDLPLDWKIGSVEFALGFFMIVVTFYVRPTRSPMILLEHVCWDFRRPVIVDLNEFVEAVNGEQPPDSSHWNPEEALPFVGQLTVEYACYHTGEPLQRIKFPASLDGAGWTQATVLHAIHNALQGGESLGDHAYFEGLIAVTPNQCELWLGS